MRQHQDRKGSQGSFQGFLCTEVLTKLSLASQKINLNYGKCIPVLPFETRALSLPRVYLISVQHSFVIVIVCQVAACLAWANEICLVLIPPKHGIGIGDY